MKKILIAIIVLATAGSGLSGGEIDSLSAVFAPGKGIVDADGDGLADGYAFHVVIPDRPTAQEAAAAADIAGRAGLESLTADFDLVLTESRYLARKPGGSIILIGSRLAAVKKWLHKEKSLTLLTAEQGIVATVLWPGTRGLAVIAGSDDTLLKTARAFFLRWPYFWEIWGREDGSTYLSLEDDLTRFLNQAELSASGITLTRAFYEFPSQETPHEALKRLSFANGQIKNLEVEIALASKENMDRAAQALNGLANDRHQGRRTEVLSYPGCGLITFRLKGGSAEAEVALPRTGYPKRLLTPSYKTPARPEAKGKEFDLPGLFTTKGTLADSDQDGLPDNIETCLIVPQDAAWTTLSDLTTRLALSSAGGSFPWSTWIRRSTTPSPSPLPCSSEITSSPGAWKKPASSKPRSWGQAKRRRQSSRPPFTNRAPLSSREPMPPPSRRSCAISAGYSRT